MNWNETQGVMVLESALIIKHLQQVIAVYSNLPSFKNIVLHCM